MNGLLVLAAYYQYDSLCIIMLSILTVIVQYSNLGLVDSDSCVRRRVEDAYYKRLITFPGDIIDDINSHIDGSLGLD